MALTTESAGRKDLGSMKRQPYRIRHGREPRLAALPIQPGCFCPGCAGAPSSRGLRLPDVAAVLGCLGFIMGLYWVL